MHATLEGHSLRNPRTKYTSCHGAALRRNAEADVLPHEIWEANTGEQAGVIMRHADGSFRENSFPEI